MISTLKLGCLLLLTAVTTACAYSQDGPLSENLSLPLTTDSQTAPITTLAIDLLAPQRPFLYDPTGASVSSSALNPEIYSSTYSSSLVQTDTQLRDSSQAGHSSPYAAGRLGLTSASGESSGQEHPSSASQEDAPGTGNDGSGQAYQSSWGTTSSFGAQSGDSSWGMRALQSGRSGRQQPQSFSAGARMGGNGTMTADSTGSMAGELGSYSASSTNRDLRGYFADSSGNSRGGRDSSSTSHRARSGAMGSGNRHFYAQDSPGGATTAGYVTGGGMGGASAGTDGDNAQSAAKALAFFPQAESKSTLGESPFSSPSGEGELHFLNPNIFAVTSRERGPSPTESGKLAGIEGPGQSSLGGNSMANSTGRYALASHMPGSGLRTNMEIGNRPGLAKHAHLKTGISGSMNP